jgi:hypothetical protein
MRGGTRGIRAEWRGVLMEWKSCLKHHHFEIRDLVAQHSYMSPGRLKPRSHLRPTRKTNSRRAQEEYVRPPLWHILCCAW